jgi:hypothetical protein
MIPLGLRASGPHPEMSDSARIRESSQLNKLDPGARYCIRLDHEVMPSLVPQPIGFFDRNKLLLL